MKKMRCESYKCFS